MLQNLGCAAASLPSPGPAGHPVAPTPRSRTCRTCPALGGVVVGSVKTLFQDLGTQCLWEVCAVGLGVGGTLVKGFCAELGLELSERSGGLQFPLPSWDSWLVGLGNKPHVYESGAGDALFTARPLVL